MVCEQKQRFVLFKFKKLFYMDSFALFNVCTSSWHGVFFVFFCEGKGEGDIKTIGLFASFWCCCPHFLASDCQDLFCCVAVSAIGVSFSEPTSKQRKERTFQKRQVERGAR